MTLFVAMLVAYLLGGFSLSFALVRTRLGRDVRELGSGNPGATNVLGLLGLSPAFLVLISDVGKGALAVLGARGIGLAGTALGLVAVAVVVGHVFPLIHGLRGGKGVATAFGAFGVLVPLAAALALVVFVLAVAVTRYVAIGSVLAAATLPIGMLTLGAGRFEGVGPRGLVLCAAATAVLIAVRHRANGRRMLAGTEVRVGESRRRKKAT